MSSGIRHVLYLAAHGGYEGQPVPLGGGAAVAAMLAAQWRKTRPFTFEVLGPALLGAHAPPARELLSFNERQYAAFCDAFREAATQAVLRHNPRETAVLANDIAEGPDFVRLARAGFHVVTLYHVDVVAYIAAIYLRGWVGAPALARFWEAVRPAAARVAPRILRLIFEQQRASLHCSARVVAPSSGMRELLLQGYAGIPPERIEVLHWGAQAPPGVPGARAALAAEYALPAGARVLVCLSRLSPEKGHDILLEALREMEQDGRLPQPAVLFICGEAAFMQGAKYERRIRALAARLRRTRVVFTGYVTGARKQMFFEAADVYLFPSRHESYGLTLVEALAAGAPAVALDHAGARDILAAGRGVVVSADPRRTLRRRLGAAIVELLEDPDRRRAMSEAGRRWAAAHPFRDSAARLAALLQTA